MAADNGHAIAAAQPPSSNYASLLAEELDTPYPARVEDSMQMGPIYLAYRDVLTFWQLKRLALYLIQPFKTDRESDELYTRGKNFWILALLTLGSIIQGILLICAIPILILFPGILGVLTVVLGTALVHLIFWPIQSPKMSTSEMANNKEASRRFASERWVFINGCCVSGYGLQQNLNVISQTFGRPVVGILNRTFGIVGDLIECIMQRALGYYSQETWASYRYVEACCKEPSVSKVVLIAHSQGGIMASQILDRLYINLSSDLIGKLEVYTFGNAALRFNNPIQGQNVPSRTARSSPALPGLKDTSDVHSAAPRVINYIEHYCNREDMVTRWGALYSLGNILNNRFCGKVFVSEQTKGHMLNQHYLDKMFPVEGSGAAPGETPFLDRHVDIDEKTMLKRKQTADAGEQTQRHNSLRAQSIRVDTNGVHHEPVSLSNQGPASVNDGSLSGAIVQSPVSTWSGTADMIIFGDAQRVAQHDLRDKGIYLVVPATGHPHQSPETSRIAGRGTKVRDLSRLWQYMNGGIPED